jgi:hypothetical protein
VPIDLWLVGRGHGGPRSGLDRNAAIGLADRLIAGILTAQLRHTCAAQELLEEGRQEGLALGEASANLRLLNRLYGPLTPATTEQIQALPLKQLQALTDALLDFNGPQDLVDWLEANRKA